MWVLSSRLFFLSNLKKVGGKWETKLYNVFLHYYDKDSNTYITAEIIETDYTAIKVTYVEILVHTFFATEKKLNRVSLCRSLFSC